MASPATCPTCGTAIEKAGEPCPRCLLELGRARPPEPPPPGSTSAPRARRRADPPVEELAKRFPELEIAARIGSGGMGAVYKARQPRIDRWVALKILSLDPADDPTFAERFRREAIVLARLDHPNVVKLYDFGERDGLFFLLLEFVDGPNLRTLMKQGLLQPAQALAVVPQMCEALQFAHDEGIVHRDIKPENVLLDAKGRVKIADFGLAKLVDADARDVSLTEVDQIVGTPHYMAPEQIRGSREVDHRADIYSLGVVFYEMLTGELPRGNFELPSRRVRVDVRLDDIVLKSLERAPERRYQHAVDVKTDVESVGAEPSPGEARARANADAPPKGEEDRPVIAGISIIRMRRQREPGRERERARARPRVVVHPNKPWEFFLTFLILWPLVGLAWNGGAAMFAIGMALVGATFWSQIEHAILRRPDLVAALKAESRGKRALRHVGALALLVAALLSLFAGHVAILGKLSPGYQPSWTDGSWARAAFLNPGGSLPLAWPTGSPPPRVIQENLHLEPKGVWELDHEKLWNTPVLLAIAFLLFAGTGFALASKRRRPPFAIAVAAAGTLLVPLALVDATCLAIAALHDDSSPLVPVLDREIASPAEPASDVGTEKTSERLRIALLRRGYRIVANGTWEEGVPLAAVNAPPAQEVQILVAEPSSLFERWRFSLAGPERVRPRCVFVIYGPRDRGPVRLECDPGHVEAVAPMRREVGAWLEGVLGELDEESS